MSRTLTKKNDVFAYLLPFTLGVEYNLALSITLSVFFPIISKLLKLLNIFTSLSHNPLIKVSNTPSDFLLNFSVDEGFCNSKCNVTVKDQY